MSGMEWFLAFETEKHPEKPIIGERRLLADWFTLDWFMVGVDGALNIGWMGFMLYPGISHQTPMKNPMGHISISNYHEI